MTNPAARLLTVQEAAQYLTISERTVWSMLKNNRLPAVRFGRTVRIDPADLDNFIRRAKGESVVIGDVLPGILDRLTVERPTR